MTLEEILAKYPKGTVQCYEECYRILEFDVGTELYVESAARMIIGRMWPLYQKMEALTKVPAVMFGLIHSMECNNSIRGCLHNGQFIIGNERLTTIDPIGRGPFNSKPTMEENWIDAALDAMKCEDSGLWTAKAWTLGVILQKCERFNGWGYITGAGRSEMDPYIWSCTSINDGYGKYVEDGKFDPSAPTNGQAGCAAIVKKLELMGRIKLTFAT